MPSRRPKGTPNKVTALLKDAILKAAEEAVNKTGGNGLVSYLEQQEIEHPGSFMTLLGKVLPMQISRCSQLTFPAPADEAHEGQACAEER